MPTLHIFPRDGNSDALSSSSTVRPIYIAGFAVVGAIVLGVGLWLGIRLYRKHAQKNREKKLGVAFLSVRGLVREELSTNEKSPLPTEEFSRDQIDESIVLPEKVLTRPRAPRSNDDVLDFHRASGNFPKPFSFALLTTASARSSMRSSTINAADLSSGFRNSFMSIASAHSHYSVTSSTSSVSFNPTSGSPRKIRQIFSPVLPDEILAGLGERVTVVQSFDDGWCLVGRENSPFATTAKSLFKPAASVENNIELGVVPAWCFMKPVQGLTTERPVRSTSLGITVQMDAPGHSSRDEILSWSNF